MFRPGRPWYLPFRASGQKACRPCRSCHPPPRRTGRADFPHPALRRSLASKQTQGAEDDVRPADRSAHSVSSRNTGSRQGAGGLLFILHFRLLGRGLVKRATEKLCGALGLADQSNPALRPRISILPPKTGRNEQIFYGSRQLAIMQHDPGPIQCITDMVLISCKIRRRSTGIWSNRHTSFDHAALHQASETDCERRTAGGKLTLRSCS